MKPYLLSFLLMLSSAFFAQKKDHDIRIHIADNTRFVIGINQYIGPSAIDTLYSGGRISAIGPVALERDSTKSVMKVGEWTEFYANGRLRSKGAYEMDTYLQCCYAGPCRQYVSYKTGPWTYYYENGQVKATGRYLTVKEKIRTSCEGGDKVMKSYTDDTWTYYNEKGDQVSAADLGH